MPAWARRRTAGASRPIDRAKAALLGVSATTLANTIRTNVSGTQAALFRQSGKEYPIIVRLRESERQDVNDVDNVLVSSTQGVVMPARNLMRIDDAVGPTQIQRKNQQRINFVSGEPEVTLSEAVEAVQNQLPQVLVPKDFSVGFGAEVEQQAEAFNQLRMVLILALFPVVPDGVAA
jgi:HAE1 family hydrophobic/amphiphilic exporter-1